MRKPLLPLLLLPSCAFFQAAAETGAVAGGAAAGGLLAGPAGAAAGAGATHAVIGAVNSEEVADDATGRLDALVEAQLRSLVEGSTDPLEAALRQEAARRAEEVGSFKSWVFWGAVIALVAYLLKQWLSSKKNRTKLVQLKDDIIREVRD